MFQRNGSGLSGKITIKIKRS